MKKFSLSLPHNTMLFQCISNERPEQRTDRLSLAAKTIFARVMSNFDPAFVTIAGLDKCKIQDEVMVRLKTFISMDGNEYKSTVNSKIIEMSKNKPTSICLTKTSCNDDIYLVLKIVDLMKRSYVASSNPTMRLVDTNAKYCKQVRRATVHILNQQTS